MSTGPGPTRKADGTIDDHVEELSELLVDAESEKISLIPPKAIDEGLDISMETPGPANLSGFMPPPPGPSLGAEDSDSDLEAAPSSLAYEDLLAKLVLPSKTPGVVNAETPPPSPFIAPPTPGIMGSSNDSSSDEQTLVTQNPLLAEEQETAAREGLASPREELPPPLPVASLSSPVVPIAPVTFQPSVPLTVVPPKPVAIYVMLGSALVILASILVILVVKFVLPGAPAPQPAPTVTAQPPEPVVTPPPPPPAPAANVPPPSEPAPVPEPEQAEAPTPEPAAAPVAEEPEKKPEPVAKTASKKKSRSSHTKRESRSKSSKSSKTRSKSKSRSSKSSKSGRGWVDPFAN